MDTLTVIRNFSFPVVNVS